MVQSQKGSYGGFTDNTIFMIVIFVFEHLVNDIYSFN